MMVGAVSVSATIAVEDSTQLTTDSAREHTPTWSPDSNEIVFLRSSCPEQKIIKLELDDLSETVLATHGCKYGGTTPCLFGDPHYSPDGTKIVYGKDDCNGWVDIYVVNSNGSSNQCITCSDSGENIAPIWYPNSNKIIYANAPNCCNTYPWDTISINPDGSGKTTIVSGVLSERYFAMSPDESNVLYSAETSKGSHIWMMKIKDLNTGNVTDLGRGLFSCQRQSWQSQIFTPGGSKIVYRSDENGNWDIYTISVDGTGKTQLTTNTSSDLCAYFSPDGSKILFVSDRSGNSDIWVMDVDGSNKVQLTTNASVDTGPTWSPDGNKIVFQSDRSGNYDIWVMDISVDTSQEVQFKGTVSNILTFFSATVYTIQIDKVISDPTGSMNEGDTAKVSYPYDSPAQVDFVEVGDKVEVHGTYTGYESGEHTIALESSGSSLAKYGDMSLLWKNETGKAYSVDISGDGNYVVAGSGKNVYLFDKTGDLKWNKSVGDYVYSVAISSDGNYVVVGSGNSVYYFDKYENRLWKHDTTDQISSVSVSDDGDNVAFTSYDGYVYYFDKTGFLWSNETANPPRTVSISSDGEKIAVGCYEWVYYYNKTGFVWNYEIGETNVLDISISSDGEYIATAGGLSSSYYFDKNKNVLWEFEWEYDQFRNAVEVSSDGENIVLGSGSHSGNHGWVYYFNKDSNIPIWENKTTHCVGSVDISSDGEYVVAGSYPTFTLYYFNNTGDLLFDYPIWVWSAKISSDGKYIVAAGNGWDEDDGERKECVYFFGPATGDSDGDGEPDDVDNCPYIYNPNQIDNNGNGIGDMCEIIEQAKFLRDNSTKKIYRDVNSTAKIQAKVGTKIFDKEEKNIIISSLQHVQGLIVPGTGIAEKIFGFVRDLLVYELIDNLVMHFDEKVRKELLSTQAQVDLGYREFGYDWEIQDYAVHNNGQEDRLIILTPPYTIVAAPNEEQKLPNWLEIFRYDLHTGIFQSTEKIFLDDFGQNTKLRIEIGDVNNDNFEDLLLIDEKTIDVYLYDQNVGKFDILKPIHKDIGNEIIDIAVGNLDNTGNGELAILSKTWLWEVQVEVYQLDGNDLNKRATHIFGFLFKDHIIIGHPSLVIGDSNNDHENELLVSEGVDDIALFTYDGTNINKISQHKLLRTEDWSPGITDLAIGDIDNKRDNGNELVMSIKGIVSDKVIPLRYNSDTKEFDRLNSDQLEHGVGRVFKLEIRDATNTGFNNVITGSENGIKSYHYEESSKQLENYLIDAYNNTLMEKEGGPKYHDVIEDINTKYNAVENDMKEMDLTKYPTDDVLGLIKKLNKDLDSSSSKEINILVINNSEKSSEIKKIGELRKISNSVDKMIIESEDGKKDIRFVGYTIAGGIAVKALIFIPASAVPAIMAEAFFCNAAMTATDYASQIQDLNLVSCQLSIVG